LATKVEIHRTLEVNLPTGSTHDGEIHFTDEHNAYIIAQNGQQIRITDIFWLADEAAVFAVSSPLLKKIYLAHAEGTLWHYDGTTWVRLADYRSRSTHTGTQAASTITGTKTHTFISDFIEAAQDAIGNNLLNGNTVELSYNDASGQIQADVIGGSLDADTHFDAATIARLFTSAAQKDDLTDGGDTTLHYHSADRNRANHSGKQLASTISDFDAAVVDALDETKERSADFTFSAAFNKNQCTLRSGCSLLTAPTAINGFRGYFYNATGGVVELIDFDDAPTEIANGDLLIVTCFESVGWVARIL